MATKFADLITRVLGNCGRADDGEDRAQVLKYLTDILKVDIPDRVGGMYAEGFVELEVGGSEYIATGIYNWPVTLRSFGGLIQINGNPLDCQRLFAHPSTFHWTTKDLSGDFSVTTAHVLAWGRKFHFKPIPADDPEPEVTIELWGTLYRDVSAITEDTTLVSLEIEELEPVMVAGATVLEALARERNEVAVLWSDIWQKRLDGLKDAATMNWRRVVMGRAV